MKYLSFDTRALSLMRIGVGLVVLLDLCIRISDLEVFYSNTGVMPLPLLFQHGWNDYFISFHIISGLWQVELLLFVFSFFCAFMLLIGYRTQLFTILSWIMMVSLHNRNPFILQGGDDLLRMVLFWGMFIPWGMRYSADRMLDSNSVPSSLFRISTFAYLLQICYIYTGSALLKGLEWNTDYTALYYTYSLEQIAMPITTYLYPYGGLLKELTRIAYYFELLIPLMFFIPIRHSFFRLLGVVLIIIFHSINELTLFIGLFPFIGIVTSLGLLPSKAMNSIETVTQDIKQPLILFLKQVIEKIRFIIRWKKPVYVFNPFSERVRTAILIFLVVFVFDWNLSNLTFVKSKLSDHLRIIGYGFRLDQSWGMFAPGVFKNDGWYVLEGITKQNDTIVLYQEKQAAFVKPASIVSTYKNDRWRKYSEMLIFSDHEILRGYYCQYSKRVWNEKHPETPLRTVRIIYMQELTLPDYQISEPERILLWECTE